jgi:hypothetical protein
MLMRILKQKRLAEDWCCHLGNGADTRDPLVNEKYTAFDGIQ